MTNDLLEGLTGGGSAAGSSGSSDGGTLIDTVQYVTGHDGMNVDVDRIVDAIEDAEVRPPAVHDRKQSVEHPWLTVYDSERQPLPEMILPGFGESYDDCGKPFLLGCTEHGHVRETTRTPGRSTCSFCAPVWDRDRSVKIVAKLEALRRYQWAYKNVDALRFHHVIVSPDPSENGYHVEAEDRKGAFEKGVDVVQDVIEELGAFTEFVAYHPFSGDHDDDSLQDDRGAWKGRLFSDRDWEGDVYDELEHRPHFHMVAIAPKIKGGQATKELEERTGWIVERIHDENNVSIGGFDSQIENMRDLARVVTYMLSHTGLYKTANGSTRSATRWRGDDINRFAFEDVKPEIRYMARRAVHEVVPDTLGLPSKESICHADLHSDSPDVDTSYIGKGDVPASGGGSGIGSSGGGGGSSSGSQRVDEFGMPKPDVDLSRPEGWDASEGNSWSVPATSAGRLDAMRKAEPEELIAQFEGVTEENVWEFKNRLEEADPDEDVCGAPLRPVFKVIPKLDDSEWVDDATAIDELVEQVDELLRSETNDLDAIQAGLAELRRRHYDDLEELQEDVDALLDAHFSDREDLKRKIDGWLSRSHHLGDVVDVQATILDELESVVDDIDETPGYLKPVTNAIEDLDREDWFDWTPGSG